MWVWWKLDKGDSEIEFVVVHNVTETGKNYMGLDDWPICCIHMPTYFIAKM